MNRVDALAFFVAGAVLGFIACDVAYGADEPRSDRTPCEQRCDAAIAECGKRCESDACLLDCMRDFLVCECACGSRPC